MAGQNTRIVAADYNLIQSNIAKVMGNGADTFGYGQLISSSQVNPRTNITAQQWINLRSDILAARWHQTGVDISGALTYPTNTTQITEVDRAAYLSASIDANTNKLNSPPPTQATRTNFPFGTISRTTAWLGTIQHTVTVTFTTADQARYFFNAGGRIEISATITGIPGSGPNLSNDNTWNAMFTAMGTIYFGATSTTNTTSSPLSSPATAIGYYNLSSSSTLIFTQAAPSGAYSANDYVLYAYKSADGTNLYFNIQFQDNAVSTNSAIIAGVNYGLPKTVDGTINSLVQIYYASGSYVSVTPPTGTSTSLG